MKFVDGFFFGRPVLWPLMDGENEPEPNLPPVHSELAHGTTVAPSNDAYLRNIERRERDVRARFDRFCDSMRYDVEEYVRLTLELAVAQREVIEEREAWGCDQ